METPSPAAVLLPEPFDWLVAVAPLLSVAVALVAAVVAAISLGIAASGRKTARKSLGIAERAEASAAPEVELYLNSARQFSAGDGYVVLIHIQVVNRSHSAIWVRKAGLWVQYSLGDQVVRSEVTALKTNPNKTPPLAFPLELKARQVADGWLAFNITGTRTNGRPVLRQSLTLTDTDGHDWTLDDLKAGRMR